MIIEPVPASDSRPFRRVVASASAILPLALLAGVVSAGLLGRTEDEGRASADRSPDPTVSMPADGLLDATLEPMPSDRVAEHASYPAAIDGLQVHDVATTLARRADLAPEGIVAVAGYLSLAAIPSECADRILGRLGAFCRREGLIGDGSESPWTPSGTAAAVAWDRLGPHLHPEFPPGVRLPPDVARTIAGADGPPLPVVLLGRFDDPRATPCAQPGRACGDAFVVRGVAWYDGLMWRRPTVLEPTRGFDVSDDPWPDMRARARAALGDVERVLVIALVGPSTLADIDPVAAAAIPKAGPRRVWYLLGLEVWPGPDPNEPLGRTRWVVVDDATGDLLADGGDPGAMGPSEGAEAS